MGRGARPRAPGRQPPAAPGAPRQGDSAGDGRRRDRRRLRGGGGVRARARGRAAPAARPAARPGRPGAAPGWPTTSCAAAIRPRRCATRCGSLLAERGADLSGIEEDRPGVMNDRHAYDRERDPRAIPRVLPPARAYGGAVLPAGARPGPHPALHQRGHGAVQVACSWARSAGSTSGRPPPRSACGPAASTTTWRTSAAPPGTIPSSRCWATSPSGTTSRRTRSAFCWELLTEELRARPRTGSRPPSSPTTTRRSSSGSRSPARRRPHPPPGREGQFLGDGGHRPLRAVLRGALPPGRSSALRGGAGGPDLPGAGLRLRPLARDLEPGLHAVQPATRAAR